MFILTATDETCSDGDFQQLSDGVLDLAVSRDTLVTVLTIPLCSDSIVENLESFLVSFTLADGPPNPALVVIPTIMEAAISILDQTGKFLQ